MAKKRHGKRGPHTVTGKANSSQNAMKHSLRSRRLLVGKETQEEFDELRAQWLEEYRPSRQSEQAVLERVILNDWFLQRAERVFLELEVELSQVDASRWTEEQHKKLELYLRYKTTAERSFHRFLAQLERMRQSRLREARQDRWDQRQDRRDQQAEDAKAKKAEEAEAKKAQEERARREAEEEAEANLHPLLRIKLPKPEPRTCDQLIEAYEVDGKTVTTVEPSNDVILARCNGPNRPKDIWRRFRFEQAIPPEYRWITKDEERVKRGGTWNEYLTVEQWKVAIERDRANNSAHIGPCICDDCRRDRGEFDEEED